MIITPERYQAVHADGWRGPVRHTDIAARCDMAISARINGRSEYEYTVAIIPAVRAVPVSS